MFSHSCESDMRGLLETMTTSTTKIDVRIVISLLFPSLVVSFNYCYTLMVQLTIFWNKLFIPNYCLLFHRCIILIPLPTWMYPESVLFQFFYFEKSAILLIWGREKIVKILQTIFSNAYSQVKNICILMKIPLNFFLLVQLTKRHRTLRIWHDPKQATSHYLSQELLIVTYICVNRHRRVNVRYISNYVTTDVYVHFDIGTRTCTRT